MPVIDAKKTGERIGALRDAAGLDNAAILDAMGFSTRNAIYKWLRGDALPTLDNMLILAALFGVKIDDIIVVKMK